MKIIIEEPVTNVEVEQTEKVILTIADFDVQHAAIEKTIIDAKGDLIAGSAADTPVRFPVGANDQALVADSGEPTGLKWIALGGGAVGCMVIIDGGGGDVSTGIKLDILFPASLTLQEYYLTGDQSGSVVADLWHCTYAEFDNAAHPVVGDSVCAAAKPTIAAAHKTKDDTLSGWSKDVLLGEVWRLNIDSLSTFERLSYLFVFEATS